MADKTVKRPQTAKPSEVINPRLPAPLPQQLKEILIGKIQSSQFIPGERIPSERDLAEMYGISRITARQALTEMIAENYLFRIPGKGTFVERADQIARKLQRGSFHVAFLINSNWYSFVQPGNSRILEGVERALRKRGYKVFFRTIDDEGFFDLSNPDSAKQDGDSFDGVILVGPMHDELVLRLQVSRVPFIVLDAQAFPPGVNCVCMDYFDGALHAVRQLLKLGHRDIGYIGIANSEKHRAYHKALQEVGIPMNPAFVEYLVIGKDERPGFQHGRDAILKMMTRESLPSALFLTNDVVALGAMEVLKQAGLRIPEDVSIIGCDDIDLYGQADPPLTTICTDLEEFGAVGVQRLFALMEAPDQPSQIIKVPLQLVIRGSAAQRAKRSPRAPKEGTR